MSKPAIWDSQSEKFTEKVSSLREEDDFFYASVSFYWQKKYEYFNERVVEIEAKCITGVQAEQHLQSIPREHTSVHFETVGFDVT